MFPFPGRNLIGLFTCYWSTMLIQASIQFNLFSDQLLSTGYITSSGEYDSLDFRVEIYKSIF